MKRLNLILTTKGVILSLALGFCLFVTSGCEREDLDSSKELGALVLKLDLVSNSEVVVKSSSTESTADELEIFDGYIFIFSELGVYNRHYTFTDANITVNTKKNATITIEEGTKIADGHKLVLIFNQSTATAVRWKQPMFGGVGAINITRVVGNGYATATEALRMPPRVYIYRSNEYYHVEGQLSQWHS